MPWVASAEVVDTVSVAAAAVVVVVAVVVVAVAVAVVAAVPASAVRTSEPYHHEGPFH